jgi:hypothetical protein
MVIKRIVSLFDIVNLFEILLLLIHALIQTLAFLPMPFDKSLLNAAPRKLLLKDGAGRSQQ